ncbi:Cof-type HAD-IIB family hydrolase [Tepidibacter aestuarii]|uniref:Cof-type HAD-IIB family hydrolase n=1 Tax=Tepidibacter aestuarii TaxID=2925782 RepID=UPI0020C09438|nr:Cof-type HAD-IIB family hydrolase [Tepidibacter aestuarii]CAH2212324.1 5-amino-6-(5-phospho-D-ribitylamino)uracil phosphatase [Tepidibacter aestuarii]
MKYKLIVTDMDGTLLSNHKEITKENKTALKKAKEMGVNVAIATGRIYTSARYYANLLGLDAPIIACNGAIIREEKTNNTLYENTMNEDACKIVANICEKFGIYYHFYNDSGFYCKELKYSSLQYSKWNETQTEENRLNIQIMDDPIEFIQNTDNILKFVIIDDDLDKLDKVKNELDKIDNIEVSKSWHNNIEVMNKGVSKGQAVKKLAEHFGVNQDEIITFGDNFNDLSMIEYAGMGVAMGNSEDKVKKKANFITDSNDQNGVAKALNELLNIEY